MSPRVHGQEGVNSDGEGGKEEQRRSRMAGHPFRLGVKKQSEMAFYITVTDATFPKLVVNKNKN